MLVSLSVRNFLLIEKIDVDLEPGFTVFTGETGAGKSVFLNTILFVLGGKFGAEIIRKDCQQASATLIIQADAAVKDFLADQYDIKIADDEIILKRIQYANRKKFFLNDEAVSQKLIQDLSSHILEFHGQNIHNYLANQSVHIDILDQFCDLATLRQQLRDKYLYINHLRSEIEHITKERKFIDNEIDYLQHIIKELSLMAVKPNEEDELADLRTRLQNSEKESDLLNHIAAINENSNAVTDILNLQKAIAKSMSPELNRASEHLDQALMEYEEASSVINEACNNSFDEEYNLDEVEERLFAIRALVRKHNKSANELPQFLEESQHKLSELNGKIDNEDELKRELIKVEADYKKLAKQIHEQRVQGGEKLACKIMQELEPLKMGNARFFVEVLKTEKITSKGLDIVTFKAATNKGMAMGSIDKIASGGELSRFMLAVKVALFDKDYKGTIIFDEIDTGLGGSVASAIGKRLKLLGSITQVLVISHQPQVAALANNHYKLQKIDHADGTISNIIILNPEEREQEIARMISADKITATSLQAAKDLIEV